MITEVFVWFRQVALKEKFGGNKSIVLYFEVSKSVGKRRTRKSDGA